MCNTSILWTPLADDVKADLFKDKTFDIDYLCVKDKLKNVFEHSEIIRLVSSHSGQLYRSGHTVRLRDSKKTDVYCIGDIAEFKIGIAVQELEVEDDEGICQAVEDVEELQEERSGQKRAINELLKKSSPGRMPYSKLKECLLPLFGERDVAVFKYGQKLELKSFEEMFKNLLDLREVEVALAVEFAMEGKVLIVSQKGFRASQFYRLFGSILGGNVLLRDSKSVELFCPGGTRLCIYNSSQHEKARYGYALSLKNPLPQTENEADEEVTEPRQSLQALLRVGICEVVASWIGRVLPAVEKSKLRAEVYFSLKEHGIAAMKKRLEQLIKRKITVLSTSAPHLIEFFTSICNFILIESREAGLPHAEFSRLFRILTVFRQVAGSLYADWKVPGDETQFYFPLSLFLDDSHELKLEVLLQFEPSRLHRLVSILKRRSQAIGYGTLILLLGLEIGSHGDDELPFDWFGYGEMGKFWTKLVEVHRERPENAEQRRPLEFLKLLRRKHRSSAGMSLLLNLLKEIATGPSRLWERIMKALGNFASVSFQNKDYFVNWTGEGNGSEGDLDIKAVVSKNSLESALEEYGLPGSPLRHLVYRIYAAAIVEAANFVQVPMEMKEVDYDLVLR